MLGVTLLLNDLLAELEGEALMLNDAVGEALIVVLADTVVLAVPEGVLLLIAPEPTDAGCCCCCCCMWWWWCSCAAAAAACCWECRACCI